MAPFLKKIKERLRPCAHGKKGRQNVVDDWENMIIRFNDKYYNINVMLYDSTINK